MRFKTGILLHSSDIPISVAHLSYFTSLYPVETDTRPNSLLPSPTQVFPSTIECRYSDPVLRWEREATADAIMDCSNDKWEMDDTSNGPFPVSDCCEPPLLLLLLPRDPLEPATTWSDRNHSYISAGLRVCAASYGDAT
jgi:hypothetical protein